MRFAMVGRLSDDLRDRCGNREAFRAFQAREEAAAPSTSAPANRMPLIIGGAVLAAVVIIVLVLALG
jgi:hypothetical protein